MTIAALPPTRTPVEGALRANHSLEAIVPSQGDYFEGKNKKNKKN
jgi:hypothetical protein